ncbi:MAG: EAL domain-containing protein [Gemmatimonadota bacterium]|nr:EAL domain-containing protein [Gemmatimonadota bacterium]
MRTAEWLSDASTAQGVDEGARVVLRNAVEPLALLDADGRVRDHNQAMAALLAPDGPSIVGRRAWDFAHSRHRAGLRSCFAACLSGPGPAPETRLRLSHRDSTEHVLQIRLTNCIGTPGLDGVLLSLRDVGRLTQAEQRLLHSAVHDRTTGLPGRPILMDRIAKASVHGLPVSVLILEVEGFASVRGGWGLSSGDDFLVALSDRIRSLLEPTDLIARLEGDQLGLLLFGRSEEAAVDVARSIQLSLRQPVSANGRSARCSVRVGISPPGDPGSEAGERIRHASLACRRPVHEGSTTVAVYGPEMDDSVNERMDVETGLRRALTSGGELEAHYQPLVELHSRRIVAFEALIRWRHPQRGLLGAGAFVPFAEESELIVELGWWMLDDICAELGRRAIAAEAVVPVHVNVAPAQVASGELVRRVTEALERHRCPVELLHLELTESATGLSPEAVARTLEELRSLGVRLAIDDFGTGHSSLSYLHRLPADVLKIDRSFVSGIAPDARQEPLVRSIIAVAQQLHLKVVAEGIETEAEAQALQGLGCDFGQGYLFSKPVPLATAYSLLDGAT